MGRGKTRFHSSGASRGRKGEAGGFAASKAAGGRPAGGAACDRRRAGGFAGGTRPYDYAAYEREPATPEYLRRLFERHEFPVDDREAALFWKYYCLLRDRNAELDLTRIMGIEATVLKHFIDSAIILRFVELKGPLLDIGTGPGFPGAPLAIRRPDLPVILAESRGKRVRFLEELKRTLGLSNVEIHPRSVREDSPFSPDDGTPPAPGTARVRDAISRALEVIPATLERVRPLLPAGGRAIFLKGPGCGQEVTAAQEGFAGIFKMVADVKYDLPGGKDQHRRLVVFEKRPDAEGRSGD